MTPRIRTIARLTGIREATLRAWERRHGFPRPHRNESNYRVAQVRTVPVGEVDTLFMPLPREMGQRLDIARELRQVLQSERSTRSPRRNWWPSGSRRAERPTAPEEGGAREERDGRAHL